MRRNQDESHSSVSALIQAAMRARLSRRRIIRQSAALGVAAPMVSAMLTVATRGAAAQTPAATPILIGSPYNLTGALASLDGPARDGGELAASELNAKGGVLGRPVKLVVKDGKTDIATCTTIAKQLIEQDKVPVLAGLTASTYALPIAKVAQAANIPFLIVGATTPLLVNVGDDIFLVPFGDNVQAAVGAEFAAGRGWKRAALLWDTKSVYCTYLNKYFKERYTESDLGGRILSELTYTSGAPDFSKQLTTFKQLNPPPDLLYIASLPDDIGHIIKQAREMGLNQPIVGGDGYDTPNLVKSAGTAAHDVYFTTHEGIYGQNAVAKAFTAKFAQSYGHPPDTVFAALGYDGVNLVADAITRAKSTEPSQIRDALAATKNFKGATGTITYQNGDRIPSKPVVLIQVKDGKFAVLEVVEPKKVPAP